MTFTVYGLRERDSKEARYIGLTRRNPSIRLANHISTAINMPLQSAFGCWLDDRQSDIEAFKIASCDTLEEGRATERAVIALCLRLEHRLFNRDHVPAHLKTPEEKRGNPRFKHMTPRADPLPVETGLAAVAPCDQPNPSAAPTRGILAES